MQYLLSIVYGIIQGLTEFLPVSSSGHLAFFQNIFGKVSEQMSSVTFTLLLHLGTLAAVVLVYYKDVFELVKSFFSLIGKIFKGKFKYSNLTDGEKFFVLLFVALIPLVLGAVLESSVEFVANYTLVIGVLWLINAAILFCIDDLNKKEITFENIKPRNALVVGLYQLVAIFPGISRSGMTITGGLMNGFNREFAVKFSFILSIPAILGSVVITLIKDASKLSFSSGFGVVLVGMFASFVSGLAAIKLLTYITKKHSFKVFAYYCLILGVVAIVLDLLNIGVANI